MISVIIPVYNVEAYLKKCLDSVLSNTYRDLEVICVNDGSPDGCLEILRSFQAKDNRIVIIDQKNQGVQTARNNGLKAAKGEYIAFVDPDDWIHPQYFQTLLHCMEKTGADTAICGCKKFFEGEEIEVKTIKNIHYRKLSAEQFNKSYYARHMVWGRLYRHKDINLTFEKEVRMAEDTLFNLCVIGELDNPIVFETETPLYYYLQRSSSIVHSSSADKMIDFVKWYAENKGKISGPWAWICLMQAIKFALSYRYAAILQNDKEGIQSVNKLLRRLVLEMLQSNRVFLKDKAGHFIMTLSPSLYRYFRLKDDPTLKTWERNMRQTI